jgi:hypothetical protein
MRHFISIMVMKNQKSLCISSYSNFQLCFNKAKNCLRMRSNPNNLKWIRRSSRYTKAMLEDPMLCSTTWKLHNKKKEYSSVGRINLTNYCLIMTSARPYLHEHQFLWHYSRHLQSRQVSSQKKEGIMYITHSICEVTAREMLVGYDAIAQCFEALHWQRPKIVDLNEELHGEKQGNHHWQAMQAQSVRLRKGSQCLTLLAIHTATSAKSSRLLSLRGSRSQDLTVRPLAPQNTNFLTQPGLEIRTIVPPTPQRTGE